MEKAKTTEVNEEFSYRRVVLDGCGRLSCPECKLRWEPAWPQDVKGKTGTHVRCVECKSVFDTNSELPLDHSQCEFSTSIDEVTITAGQGDLNSAGEFAIPCFECAERHNQDRLEREVVSLEKGDNRRWIDFNPFGDAIKIIRMAARLEEPSLIDEEERIPKPKRIRDKDYLRPGTSAKRAAKKSRV